jgi:hypothetical protein
VRRPELVPRKGIAEKSKDGLPKVVITGAFKQTTLNDPVTEAMASSDPIIDLIWYYAFQRLNLWIIESWS